jgi:hypothetical protein
MVSFLKVTVETILILIIISIFYLIILLKIHKLGMTYGKGPIFDRSDILVLLANISNLIESICTIITGYIFYFSDEEFTSGLASPLILAVFSTRAFASLMGMRTHRIVILFNYRCGNVSKSFMKKHFSLKKILFLVLLYSFLSTTPIIVLYFTSSISSSSLIMYNSVIYSFESFIFLLNFFILCKTSTHPTILVENLIYTLIWIFGIFGKNETLVYRFLFFVPVRNCCLLTIAFLSLWSHFNLLRPHLPPEPDLSDVFQNQDLYLDFIEHLETCTSTETVQLCILGKALESAIFISKIENFKKELQIFPKYQKNFSSFLIDDDFDGIQRNIEEILLPYAYSYFLSKRFEVFRRHYLIYYN